MSRADEESNHAPRSAGSLRRAVLSRGWQPALLHGALAFVASAFAAMGLTALIVAGGLQPGASAGLAGRETWVLFATFLHVGVEVASPALRLPSNADRIAGLPSGYSVDATVSVALTGATLLVLWLLFRAGRAVGRRAGGPPPVRGVHGAKVALPFALLTWLISWLPSFHPRFPHTSPMAIHVSHVSSLFWPLVLGGVAGFTGGVRSAASSMWESEWWSGDRWNRWWPGVLAGGAWMAVLAVGLSAAAVIGLGVAHPSDVATYFRTVFAGRPIGGIALVILTALLLPTMAMWVLVPAMGGCVEVSGSAVYQPYCFLGFGSWPGNPLGGIPEPSGFPRIGSAPGWTLVFLVIPLVAVVAGGVMAARRADARGPGEGAVVGALAGAVFALALMVAAILASAQARFNGPFFVVSSGVIRYGPNPGSTFQLALIWGVLGGAAGGWAARLRSRRPGSRRDPSILVLGGSGR